MCASSGCCTIGASTPSTSSRTAERSGSAFSGRSSSSRVPVGPGTGTSMAADDQGADKGRRLGGDLDRRPRRGPRLPQGAVRARGHRVRRQRRRHPARLHQPAPLPRAPAGALPRPERRDRVRARRRPAHARPGRPGARRRHHGPVAAQHVRDRGGRSTSASAARAATSAATARCPRAAPSAGRGSRPAARRPPARPRARGSRPPCGAPSARSPA